MSTSSTTTFLQVPAWTSPARLPRSSPVTGSLPQAPRRKHKTTKRPAAPLEALPGLKRLREAEAELAARRQGDVMLTVVRAAGTEAAARRRLAKRARMEKQEADV